MPAKTVTIYEIRLKPDFMKACPAHKKWNCNSGFVYSHFICYVKLFIGI